MKCECGAVGLYYACCGSPADGSSGGGCTHEDGPGDELVLCGGCWDDAVAAGDASNTRTREDGTWRGR